ncbi:torsin-1A-like [Discoglossus pictus]
MKLQGVILLVLLQGLVQAIEPITWGLFGIAAALGTSVYHYWKSPYCSETTLNVEGLKKDFDQNVFGQHLAKHLILKGLTGFMNQDNPKKALALSFHGWAGTGKNYVTQMIARNIHKEGLRSKFVHLFVTTLHFPHNHLVNTYKDQLQSWIKQNITFCERSIFIFDEVDKMHPELIEAIKPFLDYYDHLDDASYRKAIFIFLSNTGGEVISQLTFKFLKAGKKREDIKLSDMEHDLALYVFNKENTGFWHSSLIDRNLIDIFVPFLPLESKHVAMCVRAELWARGSPHMEDIVDKVVKEMTYYPKEELLFSVKGCKVVSTKVDLHL